MTMNTNCIDCMEVQNPGRISMALVKHCQWAESDARFLRTICASSREEAVVGDDPVVDGYACRQRFLRSYKFSRKEETVARRTKRWWRVKRSTATGSSSKEGDRKERTRARRRRAMATVLNRLSTGCLQPSVSVRG
ncbi:uncharacterized protein LOC115682528 [Syzygium oleosum]|uniref:uncharacterized protein LOC115682528 n=1 Tax=Syzygium oleosum TaxID=219896 RepID=UPI0011D1AC45|nr:uncharacterized protein LOC115682528 [Syzygium oleosum]